MSGLITTPEIKEQVLRLYAKGKKLKDIDAQYDRPRGWSGKVVSRARSLDRTILRRSALPAKPRNGGGRTRAIMPGPDTPSPETRARRTVLITGREHLRNSP